MNQDIRNLKQLEKEIKAVTVSDIKKVLKQVFKNEKLNLAIVGPHKDGSKFKKLLKV
jgi:predicted Zn-dependent peptidase